MASWLVKVGFFLLMVRFFFPRVFLMPAIVIAVVGFNFLGDGLRDAIDPRSRTR